MVLSYPSITCAKQVRNWQRFIDFRVSFCDTAYMFDKKRYLLPLILFFLYAALMVGFSMVARFMWADTGIVDITAYEINEWPVEAEAVAQPQAESHGGQRERGLLAEVADDDGTGGEEDDAAGMGEEEDFAEEAVADSRVYVELSAENRAAFATIESCLINGDTQEIEIKVVADAYPRSDDDFYYLFALNTYESGIAGHTEYIASMEKDLMFFFDVRLNLRQASSRLFKKFVVAVKLDGAFVPVSSAKYITNPGAVAKHTGAYPQAASIKGLLVDPVKLHGNELDELGVKQAAYNVFLSRILGPTTHASYPTIHYEYNGKSYAFNGHVISEYDFVFSTLTAKGITTSAIILNDYSHAHPELIHPKSRSGATSPYYAFNAAESGGVETIAAIGSFLADRYSGSGGHGKVYKWIIANEVNARREWNHMEKVGVREYSVEYANAVRVFYNAIKSVTANARVYISLDQQWDRDMANNPNYDARDVLDEFNKYIKAEGNIDWGLAYHPYTVPLYKCQFWEASRYVSHTASTPFITMANISVLTDYMQRAELLTAGGQVRSISLSEVGYTSSDGEALQAAAFAYAYYIADRNPYIDSFLLNRQTDAPEEVGQGLAFGLNHAGGGRKRIFEVFKHIDGPDHGQHTEFAKAIIGIEHW